MNIFFLSRHPKKNARMYCDKHVVKIILEITQLLFTAHWLCEPNDDWITQVPTGTYRKTHINHPMSIWVRHSETNYRWASSMLLELLDEYTYRYGKVHACTDKAQWLHEHPIFINPNKSPSLYTPHTIFASKGLPKGVTQVPLCMPEKFKGKSLTKSYRRYYCEDKKGFATWKNRKIPKWFV